jgi:RimJ/RimL family protein N-acetyltransferase
MPETLLPIPWETRNLSRPSFELSKVFRGHPSYSGLSEALRKKEAEEGALFVQCRAPRDSRSLFKVLRRSRFIPVEHTLVPVLRLGKKCFRACGSRPMPPGFKVVRASKKNEDFFRAARRIAAHSFRTDRFHRDRHCPRRIADRRFVHWVRELRSDPAAEFYAIRFGGKTVSFFVFRKGYLVLNATSREFAGKGLGAFFYREFLEKIQGKGLRSVYTRISTANIPALRIYRQLGFRFTRPEVTWHYWTGGKDRGAR